MKEIQTKFKDYRITIVDDPEYVPNSQDNIRKYKKEYGNTDGAIIVSRHGILISKDGQEVSSAVILGSAGATGIHEHAFVIKEGKLLICVCNHVMCLRLPDLDLLWDKELDFATCFEIYPYQDDFIIHGEVSISRISSDGEQKWEFSGEDIFTEGFTIVGNKIETEDFNNDVYMIDVETGKEIKRKK